MPPLPRLLPLHFSLSPPPSFPPSPLPCDSLWAVQKPHALIYLFLRLAGGRCAAPRSRVGGARSQGFKYWPCRLREDLLGSPQTHLATLPPVPKKKPQGGSRRGGDGEREGRSQPLCPKENGRGAGPHAEVQSAPPPSAPAPRLCPVGRWRVRPWWNYEAARRRERASRAACLRVQPFRGARFPAGEGRHRRKRPNNHGRLCFRHA